MTRFFLFLFIKVCLSVDSKSLNGKVMFGYQGWFGTDNDGLPGLVFVCNQNSITLYID